MIRVMGQFSSAGGIQPVRQEHCINYDIKSIGSILNVSTNKTYSLLIPIQDREI